MKHLILITIIFTSFTLPTINSNSQETPDMPANLLGENNNENSLANMLRMDLMRRFLEAQQEAEGQQETEEIRPNRPQPELGQRQTRQEPVDLSEFIGPEGDTERTLETLRERGVIPEQTLPAPPPASATDKKELFSDVPVENHIEFVESLIERRRFNEAEEEINKLLNRDLNKEQKIDALVMREKALFQNGFYQTVQDDYYQLKSFYPKAEEIEQFKNYLEEETGIQPVQEQLKENPNQPELQHELLQQYKQYNWLDFAEEFFANEINSSDPATIRSLTEIYYQKQDYDMMIELSQKAQEMYPSMADFPYNKGVGYYMRGGPLASDKALESFQEASKRNPSPALRQKMQWYLNNLLNNY